MCSKGNVIVTLPLNTRQKKRLRSAAPSRTLCFECSGDLIQYPPQDVSIILGNVPDAYLAQCTGLRWYQLQTAGADTALASLALRPDVLLTNASGAYDRVQAEFMLSLILAMLKKLPAYWRNQQARTWNDEGLERTIFGATVVLVGMGQIGATLSRMLRQLGAYTIGITRTPHPCFDADEIYTVEDLDAQLGCADLVVLTLPATEKTFHLFDHKRFSKIPDGSMFVNAGRGSTVDTIALYDALKTGRLSAAAIDVVEPEPLPPEHPLWALDNLIVTPHVAGHDYHPAILAETVEICARNLIHYELGEPLENVVDRGTGYRQK